MRARFATSFATSCAHATAAPPRTGPGSTVQSPRFAKRMRAGDVRREGRARHTLDVNAEVALFGASSMIGWSIFRGTDDPSVVAFCNAATRPVPPGVARGLDLDEEPAVAALFSEIRPTLIVHCAAVCNVEACERSPEFARAVNVDATRLLLAHAPTGARV